MNRVSVVVPVLNDEQHLAVLLDLLKKQRDEPFEVIIVDNGSTDNSRQLAQAAGVRVISEPRRGIPAAAAAGYDAAEGEIIARCDADSRPDARWVSRILENFSRNPDLDAVTGLGVFYDLPRWARTVAAAYYFGAYYAAIGAALARVPLWGSNMAMRQRVWQYASPRVHRRAPDLHDDMDLSCVLPSKAKVRLDFGLVVGVAGRSLSSPRSHLRVVRMAWRTFAARGGRRAVYRRWKERLNLR